MEAEPKTIWEWLEAVPNETSFGSHNRYFGWRQLFGGEWELWSSLNGDIRCYGPTLPECKSRLRKQLRDFADEVAEAGLIRGEHGR